MTDGHGDPLRFVEQPPSRVLAPYVKCFWILEGPSPGSLDDATEVIVPDGCPELIVHYGDPFCELSGETQSWAQPLAVCAGMTTRPLQLRPTGRIGMLGIRFWPGGLHPFTRVPMSELTDRRIGFDDLDGGLVGRLRQSVERATSDKERVQACERVLCNELTHVSVDPVIHTAVDRILSADGNVSVDTLARECDVSRRLLQGRFQVAVGVSPRLLCRIVRFHRIFELLDRPDTNTWAQRAAACGFFDQAHLVRDFREFSGGTPSSYLKESTPMGRCFASG